MSPTRATVRALGALVGFALPANARADVPVADKALATALFQQAKALMEGGNTHDACEKFAESQRLDPGGGTLLNLARCHEVEGKTGTAWVEFNDALAWSHRDGRPDREAFATEHISMLEPRLARIQVEVPASTEAEGLVVRRDGSVLTRAGWNSLFPVDPGTHVVEVTAPGRASWVTRVAVLPGQSRAIVVPPLQVEAEVAKAPAYVASTLDAVPETPRNAPRLAGYVIGAAGVIGLGVGTYFGLHAVALHAQSNERCIGSRCSPEGARYEDSARTSSDVSTVAIVVGATALASGAALVIFAPHGERGRRVGVVLSGRGVGVRGDF